MKHALVAVCLVLCAGCCLGGSGESFEKSFRESWRSSFISSCKGSDSTGEKEKFCTCVADEALSKMTVKELMNIDETKKRISDEFAPLCE